jgi:hypothetical protein
MGIVAAKALKSNAGQSKSSLATLHLFASQQQSINF